MIHQIGVGEFYVGFNEEIKTEPVSSSVAIAIVAQQKPQVHGLIHINVQDIIAEKACEIIKPFLLSYELTASNMGISPLAFSVLYGGNFRRFFPAPGEKNLLFTETTGLQEKVAAILAEKGYASIRASVPLRNGFDLPVDELRIRISEDGTVEHTPLGQAELKKVLSGSYNLQNATKYLAELRSRRA